MTEPSPDPIERAADAAALERSLRSSHRAVVVLIAACAVVAALQPAAPPGAAPDPVLVTVAVGLALGAIFARQSATSRVVSPRTRVALTLAAYAFSGALAVLGAFVATTRDAMQTGLGMALAAAIFSIRPPRPIGTRTRRGERPRGTR